MSACLQKGFFNAEQLAGKSVRTIVTVLAATELYRSPKFNAQGEFSKSSAQAYRSAVALYDKFILRVVKSTG